MIEGARPMTQPDACTTLGTITRTLPAGCLSAERQASRGAFDELDIMIAMADVMKHQPASRERS
jgi:hypothetical protein